MVTFQNILFPTDFSENSEAALAYAVNLAEKYDSNLHVIHVTIGETQQPAFDISAYLPDDIKKKQHVFLEKNLHALPPADLGKPKSVKHAILEGVPFYEILSYIENNHIDLVVMGTHGRTGLKHLTMGSVAENIVRSSPVPVLTVHSGSARD